MTSVAFGSFDITTGSVVDTTGTMNISCTGMASTMPYEFCINMELGSAFSGSTRRLSTGASTLDYQLYSDAGLTSPWGSYISGLNGGGVKVTVNSSGTNLSFSKTVYGRIFGSQTTARAGSYSSSFTASPFITFDESPAAGSGCLGSSKTFQTTFSATATVLASCSVSTSSVNFGSISSLGSNVDGTGSLTVLCTNVSPYNVGLSAGNGTGATVAARKMISGSNTVTYSLYSNIGRTTVWGNTIGTDTVTGTGTGSNQSLTVYGRVPVQSTPVGATYTDTVIVTVTF